MSGPEPTQPNAPDMPISAMSQRHGGAKSFVDSLRQGERRLRWFIIGWITLSTILNLIDRQTLSILAPTLTKRFHLSNTDYSSIVNWFLLSYTVMYTVAGRFVDKVGEKIGMTACIFWWSITTMLHSLATGGLSLKILRFCLGIGEPGNYPAALRVATRWFAKEERGLPIAIFSSGSSVGSLIAPPLISFLALSFGWQAAFFVPGFLGVLWVLVWVLVYRMPAAAVDGRPTPVWASDGEHGLPKSETLFGLLSDARVRAIVLARLVSDPVWVFYIYWTPKYLSDHWGYNLKDLGLYLWIPFVFGGAGGIFGGMASDWLIRRGLTPARARKRVLYAAGAVAPLGMSIGFASSSGVSLALIAVMAFVVYIWYIDTAALISDVFPERIVGSVLGLMGTAGSLGGIILNWITGHLLDTYHSYTPVFFIAGSGHLLASLIIFFFLKESPEGALAKPNSPNL
jgi:MFS transporter, ACS family, aldohexuronate transporter